jgi:hypothetical protein
MRGCQSLEQATPYFLILPFTQVGKYIALE